jgi:hypothetical protein
MNQHDLEGFVACMPNFHAELLGWAEREDGVWAEWRWRGTRRDGVTLDMRGVTVFGVRDGRIAWGRLYMEESEVAGANIDETVQRIAAGRAATN